MIQVVKQPLGPHYDLAQFQAEVRAGSFHVHKTRALDVIRSVRQCGRALAVEYARQAVLSLTPGDYAHTLKMPNGQVHDVYGKLIDAGGWYVGEDRDPHLL